MRDFLRLIYGNKFIPGDVFFDERDIARTQNVLCFNIITSVKFVGICGFGKIIFKKSGFPHLTGTVKIKSDTAGRQTLRVAPNNPAKERDGIVVD